MATFVIGGIWHGAGWTFAFWGALHGAATVIHRVWEKLHIRMPRLPAWLLTFLFVNVAWVFFRAKSWSAALKVLSGMAGLKGIMLPPSAAQKFAFLERHGVTFGDLFFRTVDKSTVYLLAATLLIAFFAKNSDEMADAFRPTRRTLALTAAIAIYALLNMNKVTEFLYFNF